MKLGTVNTETGSRLATVDDDGLWPLEYSADLVTLLRDGIDPRDIDRMPEPVEGTLAPPIRPGKIVATGLNYYLRPRPRGRGTSDRRGRSSSRSSPRA